MKLVATLALLAFVSSCASKKTTAPAPTTAPAVTQAAETTAPSKKDDKKSSKKSKAKSEKSATAEGSEKAASEMTCKSGSDERKVAIVAKGSGCELQYTKAGETKSVASQIVGNKKCEDVMNTIKEKLVAAQFTCQ